MADDWPENKGTSHKTSGSFGRTGRPGPTIEVEASRVDRASDAAVDASPDAIVSGEAASSSGTPPPDLPSDVNPDAPGAEKVENPENPERVMATPRPPSGGSSTLAAAAAGAVTAAAVVLLSSMLWPAPPAVESPLNITPQVTTSMVDALNARLQRVENRPAPVAAPATGPAKPDPALLGRLDDLEKTVATLRIELANASSNALKNAEAVTALKAMPAPTPAAAPAPAVDLTDINNRIGQVERAAGALKTQVTEQSAKPADDQPLRRAMAASLLDVAVQQGQPFAAPLAAAKPLAPDATALLAPLDGFAASGVPSTATLTRELQTDVARLTPPEAITPANAGFLERIEASAMRLVRIRRTDAVTGDGNGAVVARITAAAKRGDLAAARREIDTLLPGDRLVMQPWATRFDARQSALAASTKFAADAMAALTKPAP